MPSTTLRFNNKNNDDIEKGKTNAGTTSIGDDDPERKNQQTNTHQSSLPSEVGQTEATRQRQTDDNKPPKKTQGDPDASQQPAIVQNLVTPKPPQQGQENQKAQGAKSDENDRPQGSSSSDKTDGWLEVFNRYKKLDEDWIQQINDYIGTLLVFAGLFATVLTAFLVAVYAELQPDNTQSTAPILLDLSKQLHAISLGQVAPITTVSVTPPSPDPLHVVTIILWLLSLVVSLGAALLGILIKQWLREYMRWTTIFPVQHAVHIRYHRRQNLDTWHVEGIMTTISMGLTIGLVLFFLGLAVLSFNTNLPVAIAAATVTSLVLLATSIVVILPVAIPSCPFRSPFSSLLLITLSLSLQACIRAKNYIPSWLKRWRQLLFSKKRENASEPESARAHTTWIEHAINRTEILVKRSNGAIWTADVWSEWDGILHFSKDPMKSVLDKWLSLSWLISHQPVPDESVVQCFLDLPGPPPPALEHANADELENAGWQARDRVDALKLQFRCQCRILVKLLERGTKDFPNFPKEVDITDFSIFLSEYVWPSHVEEDEDSDEPPQTFDIDLDRASKIHTAIQEINPLSRNSLLKCVSFLTKLVQHRRLFLSDSMEFRFFSNILGIYFMLVNNTDPEPEETSLYDSYHRTLANIISADESSVYTYQDSSDPQSPSTQLKILRKRIEFAGALLSFSSSMRFYGTLHWKLDVSTIILYITAAVQLAHKPNLSIRGSEKQTKFMLSTRVFWAVANIVVNTRKSGELVKEEKYRKQIRSFLEAVKLVLKAETATGVKWSEDDHNDRCDLVDFFVLYSNRRYLPEGFAATLDQAHKQGTINVDKMLSECTLYVVAPGTGKYLLNSSDYIDFLYNSSKNNTEPTSGSSKR